MIFISHPFETTDAGLRHERERYGRFFTQHIQSFFESEAVLNFPLNWYLTREAINMTTLDEEAQQASLTWLAKADAVIFIPFPTSQPCLRTEMERKAALRMEILTAELPFFRQRFDRQKRVLNLLRSELQNA